MQKRGVPILQHDVELLKGGFMKKRPFRGILIEIFIKILVELFFDWFL